MSVFETQMEVFLLRQKMALRTCNPDVTDEEIKRMRSMSTAAYLVGALDTVHHAATQAITPIDMARDILRLIDTVDVNE